MKNIVKWLSVSLLSIVLLSNFWIINSTSERVISDSRELLGAEVGLVLGTSKQLTNGNVNPFFANRIKAASELILSGKVEKLLLSGSRDSIYYDEAADMMKALVKIGVPVDKLILDKNGDRTLYSIARMRDIYGFDQCIIVTQKYHAYRALFIANNLGIEATCYVATSPNFMDHIKAILREVFARTKAVIDLYILK